MHSGGGSGGHLGATCLGPVVVHLLRIGPLVVCLLGEGDCVDAQVSPDVHGKVDQPEEGGQTRAHPLASAEASDSGG